MKHFIFLRVFLFYLLPSGLLLGLLLSAFHILDLKSEIKILKFEESARVKSTQTAIKREFEVIHSDLKTLADSVNLHRLIESSTSENQQAVADEYLSLSLHSELYDQIRFINKEGQEKIRVNFQNGTPMIIADKKLQNKASRYYFQDTLKLSLGFVFVSPLDLNIEQGEVEYPLKPMIRFGTPVSNGNGEKQGVIILNYLASLLLEQVKNTLDSTQGDPLLLNSDGYWLLATNSADEWGFMFKNKRSFKERHPQLFDLMQEQKTGQIINEAGLFTFATIYPALQGQISSTGATNANSPSLKYKYTQDYYWIIISHVPARILSEYKEAHWQKGIVQYLLLLPLLMISSGTIAWFKLINHQNSLKLQERENFLNTITNRLGEGLLVFDNQANVTLINPQAEKMLEWQATELLNRPFPEPICLDKNHQLIPKEQCPLLAPLRNGQVYHSEDSLFTRKMSDSLSVAFTASPLIIQGKIEGVVVVFQDITERKEYKSQLERLATHDPLTGLINRREMESRFSRHLQHAQRYHHSLSVIMIDVDHFKQINDQYGHLGGDEVLRFMGNILNDSVRNVDIASRYGGEEFLLVLPETDITDAKIVAERLRYKIANAPIYPNAHQMLSITVSMGVASYSQDHHLMDLIIDAADKALYVAKNNGRNQVCVAKVSELVS